MSTPSLTCSQPCTRLGRECKWDVRWGWNDATSTTQKKHANVTTAGNTVWDRKSSSTRPCDVRRAGSLKLVANRSPANAPRSPSSGIVQREDKLPDFAALTTDEDRERKAATQLPGTFAVVATPTSFASLPEYAGASSPSTRRPSVQSGYGSVGSPEPFSGRAAPALDPNTVVLERFEEPVPTSRPVATPSSQSSMPDAMRQLSLSASPKSVDTHVASPPHTRPRSPEDRLVRHFREHVAKRILPQVSDVSFEASSPASLFEREASRFQPVGPLSCISARVAML